MATILQSEFFVSLVLPFLLVFTVVFAVLQKTKILGDGKKQIDALVALAVGLIVIAFARNVEIIANMTAFLGVAIVVILVFLILTGAFYEPGKFEIHQNVKYAGMAIAALAVIIAMLVFTKAWDKIKEMLFNADAGSGLVANMIFIGIIIVAVVVIWVTGGEKSSGGKSS